MLTPVPVEIPRDSRRVEAAVVAFLALILCAVGTALGQHVLYSQFVVPRLSQFHSVPIYWWAFVFSPVLGAVMAVVFVRPSRWFLASVFGALGVTLALGLTDALQLHRGLPVSHDSLRMTSSHLVTVAIRAVAVLVALLAVSWATSRGRKWLLRQRAVQS